MLLKQFLEVLYLQDDVHHFQCFNDILKDFFVLLMIDSFNTIGKLWGQNLSNTIYVGLRNFTPCSINVLDTHVHIK